jgi:Protein of unknown function (DUF4238)
VNTGPGGPRNNPTKDAHTVTACLLARFADTETGKLKAYYVPRGLPGRREYDNPPSRVGRVREYMKHEPQEHEDYWNTEVENQLPAAFAAVDDGTILDRPELVSVLKDCIALHWARSAAYMQEHEERFKAVTEQQKRLWLQNPSALERAFYFRYGLYPAGMEALNHINDLLHEKPGVVTTGEWFAERVDHHLDVARKHFAGASLEVARPPARRQFLIGDSPALSIGNKDGRVYTKVPLFEAGTLTLPIGPFHSIGLGKGGDKWVELDDAHVTMLNAIQVDNAVAWVMYHPYSGLKTFVDEKRPAAA